MKPTILAAALVAATAHHATPHSPIAKPKQAVAPPAQPCSIATVPDGFSVTFKNKGLVSDLINLLNDAPMRESDRAVMRATVFGEMSTALAAWCAANAKHK